MGESSMSCSECGPTRFGLINVSLNRACMAIGLFYMLYGTVIFFYGVEELITYINPSLPFGNEPVSDFMHLFCLVSLMVVGPLYFLSGSILLGGAKNSLRWSGGIFILLTMLIYIYIFVTWCVDQGFSYRKGFSPLPETRKTNNGTLMNPNLAFPQRYDCFGYFGVVSIFWEWYIWWIVIGFTKDSPSSDRDSEI